MSLDVYLESQPCEHCGRTGDDELWWRNITHNLNTMADQAGVYYAMWRPEEIGARTAGDLIPHLDKGLALLRSRPDDFKKWDAPNGWGRYENLVDFVESYLEACRANPSAIVRVSR